MMWEERTSIPPILYHYTDKSGLIGILSSKTMWASNILYQNDSSEFQLGIKLFLEELERIRFDKYKYQEPDLINKVEENIKYFNVDIFTISFSEKQESLNQFRSYSKSIPAYSIGIDTNDMKNSFFSKKIVGKIYKCRYTKSQHKEIIYRVINKILKSMGLATGFSESIIMELATSAIALSPIIKHEAFKEEKEWRFVFDYISPIEELYNFREGNSCIIPYLAIPIKVNEIIKEVIVGPTPQTVLAYKSTVEICKKYGVKISKEDENIFNTEIPFRNW